MTSQQQKQYLKDNYNHIKERIDVIKLIYVEEGLDLTNLPSIQKTTIKFNESKLWIFAGLVNNNRAQYDRGMRQYQRYSEEILSSQVSVSLLVDTTLTDYENSEALRQAGITIQESYNLFKRFERIVFG